MAKRFPAAGCVAGSWAGWRDGGMADLLRSAKAIADFADASSRAGQPAAGAGPPTKLSCWLPAQRAGQPTAPPPHHPGPPAARRKTMGDLAAWLGAIHKTCGALLTPLDNDYGVETVEDLLNLDAEDIDQLVTLLKKSPGKNFRKALEVLAMDAALPGDAAGAGPKSIPEAVPPEKPEEVNLHTVGVAHDDAADTCAPEPELLPSPSAAAATSTKPNRFSKGKGFGSMRFDGVVPAHAQELKHGMNGLGADMNIINMTGGGDIDLAVQQGILEADAFIVFGSAKYGEDTGNAACTYFESKFAQSRGKKIILIRMIP
eukprot:COSAG01_NODE_12311_length_1762_cov_1.805773_1_plen_315_part_01